MPVNKTLDLVALKTAAKAAFAAGQACKDKSQVSGCGRVYVSVSNGNPGYLGASAVRVLKSAGFMVTNRPHQGPYKYIYVGYDNASGRVLPKGDAIAKAFQDHGFKAYCDGDGD